MMAAITGRRASQLLTNREGMGSTGQDFNADEKVKQHRWWTRFQNQCTVAQTQTESHVGQSRIKK